MQHHTHTVQCGWTNQVHMATQVIEMMLAYEVQLNVASAVLPAAARNMELL